MRDFIERLLRRRYIGLLEADVARLRAENRALMNSLLGTAGYPPVEFPEAPKPQALPRLRKRSWHIDRAYFAGDASQRAQLAARMMREDPAAFREMVFAGLRALEAAEHPARTRSVASAVGATLGSPVANGGGAPAGGALRQDLGQASPAPTAQSNLGSPQRNDSAYEAHLASYAAFERAANDDLERSVGTAIERTLAQALPSLTSAGGATKRALSDWTQTTLAAHRGKSARTEMPSSRREVAPSAPLPRASHEHTGSRKDSARSARTDGHELSKGRVDYRKLSDEQILEL